MTKPAETRKKSDRKAARKAQADGVQSEKVAAFAAASATLGAGPGKARAEKTGAGKTGPGKTKADTQKTAKAAASQATAPHIPTRRKPAPLPAGKPATSALAKPVTAAPARRATTQPVAAGLVDHLLGEAMRAGRDHATEVLSWHAHFPFARALISLLEPRLVVELGVHKGDSLLSMASSIRDLGQTGRVIGIDTWGGDDHAGHYDGDAILPDLMRRAAQFGPSLTLLRATFAEALAGFADGSIDLLHIDGLHTYEAVRADFTAWRPKLSSRGVVLFHDTAVTSDDFGVWQLWEEIRGLGPSCNFPFGNGLGVLAPGKDVAPEVAQLLDSIDRGEDRAGRNIARMFEAVGLAHEAGSLRLALQSQAEAQNAALLEDRSRAAAEIDRLNQLIEEERAQAGAEFTRLREEADTRETSAREASRLVVASLQNRLEDERRVAGSEQARLEQLIGSERERAAAEFQRLEQEAERREAEALARSSGEIARLETLIADERAKAGAEFARLQEEGDRREAAGFARAGSEAAMLESLLTEERQQASEEYARLQQEAADQLAGRDSQIAQLRAQAEDEAATVAALQAEIARLNTEAGTGVEHQAAASASLREEIDRLKAEAGQQAAASAAFEAEIARLNTERAGFIETDAASTARLAGLQEDHDRLAGERAALLEQMAALSQDKTQDQAALSERSALLDETEMQRRLDREAFSAEEARLNQLIGEDRAAGGAEIDRLNREIAGLHREYQGALHNARLKSRLVRRFKRVAFPLFRALPLPKKMKNRLRLSIINRYGQQLQLVPPKSPALTTQTQLLLRQISPRTLALARASTGAPVDLPKRSVSVIIPVYNQIEYTLRCLDSIRLNTQDIDYEVIVVDDCSSDMTEIMLSARDNITYIRNPENRGFIGSCNAGLTKATKTYICYLNNDTEVTPRWLSALVDTFEMHPGTGMVGSQLIYPDGRLQEAGGIIWDDFSGWNWGRLQDPEAPKFQYARQADYCSGAAILLPRALAHAIGGFDPEFTPAYGEDSDMAFRLRAMGLSVMYQPLSRVVHYEGVTSGTDTTKGVKAYQVINAEKLKHRWSHVLPHQGPNGVDPDRAADRGRIGRVLVIDQITPETDKDAGSITALELMLGLRDLGYKISFIPCSNFTFIPDYSELLGAHGIESVLYPYAKSVEDHLTQTGDTYDAVVLFRVNTASDNLATVQRLAPSARVIFHNSDLHFLREERAKHVDNPNVAESRLSPESTKRVELSIIEAADVNIVHSHFEKELLAGLIPAAKVVVFPWVYEPRGAGKPFAKRQDIVFLGGYRHYPNVDAVLHYAKDVAPLMGAKMAGVKFRAIGSNPTDEMKALASDNLKIEGFVEDLDPVLGAARVMLVPLRYGAGLKGKIVTAMAHGLPVVTTSVGAEGMALTDGENVLIADSPEEMAAAVQRLYTDAALWQRLALNGLRFVAKTTSRAAGYRIVAEILDAAELAQLPLLPASADARDGVPAHHMPAGTPASLRDPAGLARAALQASGAAGTVADCLLWLPHGTSLTAQPGPGPRMIQLGQHEGHAPKLFAGVSCLLVDAFDDHGTAEALTRAKAQGALEAGAVILFLPPVLAIRNQVWQLHHSLSGLPVDEAGARAPAHIRHAGLLAGLSLRPRWQADASLTGFPGLTLAVLG
ncbi:glycosyltransferase [Pseudogemmobacter bohemicus]|uniref:glycosyltransferase n=1 Tax=Pseudogemmobacter bohemicus TaxID=2250708 RepID=UPI000DD2BC48|nr:glycosyltransferase [Pseudogemmobacter bohemicus]